MTWHGVAGPVGEAVRVVVVDHRRSFSEAVAARLAQEPGIVIVAVAHSSEEAEAVLSELNPMVGAVAVDLPGEGGLLLVTRCRRAHPSIRWVALAGEGEPLSLADAIVAGASGYLTKDSSAAALVAALRGAAEGLSITPEELLRRALMELDNPPDVGLDVTDGYLTGS